MKGAQRISFNLLVFTIIVGLFVIAGWYSDNSILKSVFPGLISMKFNTALGLILLAISTYCFSFKDTKIYKIFGAIISIFVFSIAALTLGEYLFGKNFKIDEFIFLDLAAMKTKWPPGRMAPVTSINFIFISIAQLLHAANSKRFGKLSQSLVIIGWVIAFQAFIGYMSGITYAFGSAFYTQIAIHTSVLFIALTTALLLLWRNEGYLKNLSSNTISGKVGRKLLLAAVIVPPLINALQHQGQKANLYDTDFGVLIRVIGSVVFFSWIAMQTGRYLAETDEKRAVAEQAQKLRTEELQKALQARDDLLSICSHELRTPISSMKLQTQFIKRKIENHDQSGLSPEKMNQVIDQFDKQIDRLTRLIEEMLDFSRINSGTFTLSVEEFDLHTLVIDVLERFNLQLKSNHCKINVSIEKPLMVKWDVFRIDQLLTNLLTNAIKYGGNKPIELRISKEETKQTSSVLIEIKDQGMGIASSDLERIFEPYERAISVNKISGLGLGLYISRRIVTAHGGTIQAKSSNGLGATFSVSIPTNFSEIKNGQNEDQLHVG